MSTQEAFDVLGLDPTPSPREIKAAHRRLAQLVDPEQGGSHYLLWKIDEARDVLLGE
jgi:curved DNA-binding protein CbpA